MGFLAKIEKVVRRGDLQTKEELAIRFEDGPTISVSLRLEDYRCAEALLFEGGIRRWFVIRPDS